MPGLTPESATPEAAVARPGPETARAGAPAAAGRPRPRRLLPVVGFNGALGFSLLLVTAVVALFAAQLAPYDPWRSVAIPFQPPGPEHWLGTDDLGRDLLSGVIVGVRTSLIVGLLATGLATGIGAVIGAVSGYFGDLVDDVLMRFTEFFQVIPRFFLALVAIALFEPGLRTITLVLGLTSWPMTARLLRSQILSVRERTYVEAARGFGASHWFTVRKHVLPNSLSPVIVHSSLMVGQMILIEASLAFLGLGDPNHISLGYLLRNAQPFLRLAWWMFLFPGIVIGLVVLAFNLVGDSIGDRWASPSS